MEWNILHLVETASTNSWLKAQSKLHDHTAVWTDFQTSGRGQKGNHWEGERAKNLLFSLLIHPSLAANRQFHISMAVSLAIVRVIRRYIPHPEALTIKWPNDIYWQDSKIGGILIENTLQGTDIRDSIIGIGLNINQTVFRSSAPNPVSLKQITGNDTNRETLMRDILDAFDDYMFSGVKTEHMADGIKTEYMSALYRRDGLYAFEDANGRFMAAIADVEDDGRLILADDTGHRRRYAFKEVNFVI